jgi:hypothetical protein
MQLRSHKTAISLATGVVFLAIGAGTYAWYFGFATIAVVEARYTAKQVPIVRKVPVRLTDSALTQSPGRKVGFCGYDFDVPWSDLNDSKTKSSPTKRVMYFDSGLIVAVTCSPPRTFVNTFLSAGKITPEDFRQVYGDDALQSDFALTRLMLETTPNKITLRTEPKDASATLSMLIVKSLATPPADSGMFLLHADEFDGFQYEDPTLHPKRVLVDLFAPNLSLEFAFLLNHEGASPRLTQSDINRVIQTVHKEGTRPVFANASLAGSQVTIENRR